MSESRCSCRGAARVESDTSNVSRMGSFTGVHRNGSAIGAAQQQREASMESVVISDGSSRALLDGEPPLLRDVIFRENKVVPGLVDRRHGALFTQCVATYRKDSDKTPSKVWPLRGCSVGPVQQRECMVKARRIPIIMGLTAGKFKQKALWGIPLRWEDDSLWEPLTVFFSELSVAKQWRETLITRTAAVGGTGPLPLPPSLATPPSGNGSSTGSHRADGHPVAQGLAAAAETLAASLPQQDGLAPSDGPRGKWAEQAGPYPTTAAGTRTSGDSSSNAAFLTPRHEAATRRSSLASVHDNAYPHESCRWATLKHHNGVAVYLEDDLDPDPLRGVACGHAHGMAAAAAAGGAAAAAERKLAGSNGVDGSGGAMMVSAVVRTPPSETFEALMDVNPRRNVGNVFAGGLMLEAGEDGRDVLLLRFTPGGALGWAARPRDLVVARTWRQEDDGTYIILYQSTTHPAAPVQSSMGWLGSGPIRGEVHAAGITVAPLMPRFYRGQGGAGTRSSSAGRSREEPRAKDGATMESPECLVTMVMKVDPRGWLSSQSWLGRRLPNWVRLAWAEPFILSVIALRDRVEQERFVVQPFLLGEDDDGDGWQQQQQGQDPGSFVLPSPASVDGTGAAELAAAAAAAAVTAATSAGVVDEVVVAAAAEAAAVAAADGLGAEEQRPGVRVSIGERPGQQHHGEEAGRLPRNQQRRSTAKTTTVQLINYSQAARKPSFLKPKVFTDDAMLVPEPQVEAGVLDAHMGSTLRTTGTGTAPGAGAVPAAASLPTAAPGAHDSLLARLTAPHGTTALGGAASTGAPVAGAAAAAVPGKAPSVHGLSTCDPAAWSCPGNAGYKLRGPTYLKDRKKIAAAEPVFALAAVDLVRTKKPLRHAARLLPSMRASTAPFTFMVNIIVPGPPYLSLIMSWAADYNPEAMGSRNPFSMSRGPDNAGPSVNDGDYYYSDHDADDDTMSPADTALARFLAGDDTTRNNYFKLIPRIVHGSWIIKQSVGTTPVMLGKKLRCYYYRGRVRRSNSFSCPAATGPQSSGMSGTSPAPSSTFPSCCATATATALLSSAVPSAGASLSATPTSPLSPTAAGAAGSGSATRVPGSAPQAGSTATAGHGSHSTAVDGAGGVAAAAVAAFGGGGAAHSAYGVVANGTGPGSNAYSTDPHYMEVDVDVASSSVAAHVVGLVQGATRSLVVDLGVLLEGGRTDELPEALLGTVRFSYVDLTAYKWLDTETGMVYEQGSEPAHLHG